MSNFINLKLDRDIIGFFMRHLPLHNTLSKSSLSFSYSFTYTFSFKQILLINGEYGANFASFPICESDFINFKYSTWGKLKGISAWEW